MGSLCNCPACTCVKMSLIHVFTRPSCHGSDVTQSQYLSRVKLELDNPNVASFVF